MRDELIFLLAIIPILAISLVYYVIDPTTTYLIPIVFASLLPSTWLIYYLLGREYEKQKVK